MTAPSGDQLHQLVEGTFVGPVASRYDTPAVAVISIDWNAYDVPRLWDALRREADEPAWTQAAGFKFLAELLLNQHKRLRQLRDLLADSWDPQINEPAVNVFSFLDDLIAAMADDAVAHACTSRGLNGILTALTTAKAGLEEIKRQWDSVTTDWVPEWWDHEADNLNKRARQIMATADRTAGDHRQQITVPGLYAYPVFVEHDHPPQPDHDRKTDRDRKTGSAPAWPSPEGQTSLAPPPPVPGYEPVPVPLRDPELASLQSLPRAVPATPGSPISMLPVPPGNPYAPAGGAYVLPGPGIGRGGWIYPMPPPLAAPAPPGMPPAPMGGHERGKRPGRGHGELVWEVAKGVPPIIGGDVPTVADRAGKLGEAAEEAFVDWFADLATPWTDELAVEIPRETPRPPEPTP